MDKADKDKFFAELRGANPYPEDLFRPLSKKEIKGYVKLLMGNGYSSDRIHAHWMRLSWEFCVHEAERLLEDTKED